MKKIALKMIKGLFQLGIFCLIVVLCYYVGNKAYNYVYHIANQPSENERSVKEVIITVEKGATTKEIAKLLEENGLIRSSLLFELKSRYYKYDGKYKEGEFALSTNMSEEEIMEILMTKGAQAEGVRFTIPEGYTVQKIAETLEEQKICTKEEFMKALNEAKYDYKFLDGIPDRSNKFEGYLFPDTYEVRKGADATEIVSKMFNRFDEIVTPEYYKRAAELGYTMDEIIIIASIIEQEAKLDEERPIIAGVIYNRLNSDINLQMCSTVMYALGKRKEHLLLTDLEIDSPYNTYLYGGLPVGPICNPGAASIRAALYPEEHDYFYFVLKDEETGEHVFTSTGEEHNAAKKKYNQKF
jgi:UPF0755 protein